MTIDPAHKLRAYNGALVEVLGTRPLSSLAEDREPRRVLDQIWAGGALVRYALERGDWNFATRAIELEASTSLTPLFGYQNVFTKPDDMRRLTSLSSDQRFMGKLLAGQYVDEAGLIFSDWDPLYLKYVSDDEDYGTDSSRWTEAFFDYLKGRLAFLGCERITASRAKLQDAKNLMDEALKVARSDDAMAEGTKVPFHGTWARARGTGRTGGER